MLDLARLSPAQREAVLAGEGPLLILAGPGSGKTTVLAARIAHLVLARGVGPSSILALTFTAEAARTLRTRLVGLLGPPGQAVDTTTFHAFGLRVARQWAAELGYAHGPLAVYGPREALALLREAAGFANADGAATLPLREMAEAVERYRLRGPLDDEPGGAGRTLALSDLAAAYEALLRRRGALDYPAMLALPLRLFREQPRALRLYQTAYRHVLGDEFQDVCAAQFALLRLLADGHRNLVVVGDPLQTLYGFRGADVRFLLDFRAAFPDARVLDLAQNFRSTGRIVALANALGAPLGYRGPLWTENAAGEPARVYVAADERAEAAFVAAELARLHAAGELDGLGEAAILYRTNRQAQELCLALRAQHLPYRVRGDGDLFARREVKDAVAYLRLAHNPADGAALARIANVPPRRLGRLAEILGERPVPVDALVSLARRLGVGPASLASAARLAETIGHLHASSAALAPAALLDAALEQTGYRAWLEAQADGAPRLAHLDALRAVAARTTANVELGAWLADLALGEELAGSADDERTSVLLTTIHQAKGGEWRAVFVVGAEEGLLPHARSLAAADDAHLDEERRIAYVAVTRPRERLYLTYCRERRRRDEGESPEPRRPSRFLRELPGDLLARAA